LAAFKGDAAATKQLLAARCDVDIREEERGAHDGATALFIAAGYGHTSGHVTVIELLIANRCNVNLQTTRDGFTPIYYAASQGHMTITEQVMDRLIAARCDIDLRNKESTWPLYAAACAGHASVTALLIAARCSIDLQTNDGGTALHAATSKVNRENALGSGHEKVMEQLIEARCNLDLQTTDGATALQLRTMGTTKSQR
jgi:ankyrin repeat protein